MNKTSSWINRHINLSPSKLWVIGMGSTARKSYLSIMDQALLSGTNFVSAYVLARFSGQEEFGSYILAFSVMIIITGIQHSILTSPMSVLGTSREDDEFRRYSSTMFIVQVFMNLIIVALCGLVVFGMYAFSFHGKVVSSLSGMTLALFFIQFQEFCRRLLFVKLRTTALFVNDMVNCAIRLAGVFLLVQLAGGDRDSQWLTGMSIFLVTGIAGLVTSVLGLLQIRRYLKLNQGLDLTLLRENWNFGRWTLGSFIGNMLQMHALNFVVAGLAGVAATAALEAPRLIVSPLQTLYFAAVSVLTPKMSQKFSESGRKGLADFLPLVTLFWGMIFSIYALTVMVAPEFWLDLFYRGHYRGGDTILVLWSLVFLVNGLGMIPGVTLMAMRRPDIVMYLGVVSGGLIVLLSIGLAREYGVMGAVVARLIGETIYLVTKVHFCLKIFRSENLAQKSLWSLIWLKPDLKQAER